MRLSISFGGVFGRSTILSRSLSRGRCPMALKSRRALGMTHKEAVCSGLYTFVMLYLLNI